MRNSSRSALALGGLLLAVASLVWAATPTLDAAVTTAFRANVPTTPSFTTGASGSWMVVFGSIRAGGPSQLTAVTFGATSLTQRKNFVTGDGNCRIQLWDGTVPTGTTANMAFTMDNGIGRVAISITSWNAVVAVGTPVTGEAASGNTLSTTVSTLTTDIVTDATCLPAVQTPSPGGSQTINYANFNDESFTTQTGSRQPGAVPNVTMTWSPVDQSNGTDGQVAYALNSVLPPPLAKGTLLLLGVGK
jgi:hypothetical protein